VESADSKARRYEQLYPATGVPDAQAAERMERLDRKAKAREGGRLGSRFVTVPELPWHRGGR
jgi:hypothetical protein